MPMLLVIVITYLLFAKFYLRLCSTFSRTHITYNSSDFDYPFAKLSPIHFHPLEVVSRYRDPQVKVGATTHICLIEDHKFANIGV